MADMTRLLNGSKEFNWLNTLNPNTPHLINVLYGLTCLRPKPAWAHLEPANFISCSYQVERSC